MLFQSPHKYSRTKYHNTRPFPQILIALLLTSLVIDCYAITNIESQRKRGETEGLKGEIEFTLSGKSGNNDKQLIEASARADYRQQQHQMLGIINHEREKNNGVENSDNSFVHLRYIHHNTPAFAWESYIQYQQDSFKSLDSRSLVGGGARFNTSPEDESYLLILGVGAYYTEEVYDLQMGKQHDDYVRASTYASYVKPLGANATLSNTLYWQPRLSQPSDCYVYNNLALELKINASLSLRITVESQYDSDPVEDNENADHNYKTSLLYRF